MQTLEVVRVEYMPHVTEPGKLYVSEQFQSCMHICPCGCGHEIYIPFEPQPGDPNWTKTEKDGKVTLRPSLLNRNCKAHYFITDNQIQMV